MAFVTESLLLDLSAVLIVLATTFIVFCKWCFSHWKSKGVFCLEPSIPFGNAKELVMQKRTMGLEFKSVYDEYKKRGLRYGGYYFFMRPIFIPVDLDLIKHILTKDFAHFTDHIIHVNEESDPLSVHLFSLKGQKWKNLRAKLTPTFTSGKMKMMFQTLVDCSTGVVNVIDKFVIEKQAIDIKEIVGRFTTDIIGSCAFGIDCNSLKNPDSEFRQYGKKFFDTSVKDSIVRLLTLTAPEIFTIFKLSSHRKDVTNFFMNAVKETVNYREANNVIRKDFMHLLLQLKNNVKITENDLGDLKNNNSNAESALTMTELAAQCFVFFLAGFETSSTTSTFCLYELSKNPKLQENLRDEINRVLEKHNGKITYDAMMEMVYMDKCINETLRKYPPVPVHTRECTETYRIPNSNLVLEKGSFVFIPALGIQRDPEFYPDPDKFDPERFSEENKASRHSAAWTPFGDGPRACIGIRFGVMQTKVGLTILLKHYKFTLNPRTESPLTMDPGSFVLSASTGVWLNAEKIC